jgi:hypothetical protein
VGTGRFFCGLHSLAQKREEKRAQKERKRKKKSMKKQKLGKVIA